MRPPLETSSTFNPQEPEREDNHTNWMTLHIGNLIWGALQEGAPHESSSQFAHTRGSRSRLPQ
eukprot:532684-Pyramimonas_sp.AAC.1